MDWQRGRWCMTEVLDPVYRYLRAKEAFGGSCCAIMV